MRSAAIAGGCLVAAVGLVVMAAWITGAPSVLPAPVRMFFDTALGLTLGGSSIALAARDLGAARARVTRLLAAPLGLLGAVTLGEYATGRVAGIDNPFGFPPGAGASVWPGRMAPTIAACFVILAVCVVLLTLRREWAAQALALASLTLSLTAVVGHLYGAQGLYRVSAYKGMPPQVALLLSVAGAGVLLARPDRGFVSLITDGGPGGAALRRLLVPAVAIPVAGGAIAVDAVREAAVAAPFAFAASAIAMALAGGSVVWINAARLRSTDLRRTSAEDTVARERRTAGMVRLLRSIAMAANDSDAMEEVAAFCLEEVCRFTGWPAGHLWLLDDAGDRLAPSGVWQVGPEGDYTSLRRVTEQSPSGSGPRRGEGLPGQVWATGQPAWIDDAARDPGLLRPGVHEDLGVRGAFAFPVVSAGEVVAILELFSRRPQARDEDLLGLTADVGSILARVADRARAAELLRRSEERIRRVIETAGDAFVSLNVEGEVSGWNRRAEVMFGWSAEEAAGRPLGSLILSPRPSGNDGDGLPAGLLAAPGSGHAQRLELTGLDRAGREFPIELTSWALREGSSWSIMAFIRDVSERKKAEEALASLAAVVESTDDAIVTKDLDGRILTWNRGAERLYGYRAEEVVGRFGSILGRPGWEQERGVFMEELGRGRSVSAEVDRVRKDGSVMTLSLTLSAIRDGHGRMVATSSISRDITARKRAEETQARLAAIVENSDDAIIGKSLDGTIVAWNRGAERLYGYTADEIVGQQISRLAPPDRTDETGAILRRLQQGGSVEHLETTRMRKDGSHVDVSITVSPVVDATGRLIGASTITRDITARRWAEEALRESEERFRLALSSAPIGIALVALDGRWLQVNPALCAIVGRAEQDLVGRRSEDVTHPEDLAIDRPLIDALLAGETRSYQVEKRYFHADGHLVWILLSVSLVRDPEGAPRYFISQIEDMSDRKRAETELRDTNERLRSTLAESERQWRELSLLNEMGDMLLSCATGEEAYEVIAQFGGRLVPGTSGMLLRPVPPPGTLEEVAGWGEAAPGGTVFTYDDCWALRRGKLHRVLGSSSIVRCRHLESSDADWSICIPLMAQGEVLGLLHVNGHTREHGTGAASPEAVERLAVTIAEHLSLAIANLQLRETLRAQSVRDPLTGLYNRHYMDDCLEREVLEAGRASRTVAILAVDVDHFREHDDRWGDPEGGRILQEVAATLLRVTRSEEVLCRLGGEQLLVILPEASLEVAAGRAEDLRRAALGVGEGAVTLSIGVAAYPLHGAAPSTLVRAADLALYQAKREGRNRVCIAPAPEPGPGTSPED